MSPQNEKYYDTVVAWAASTEEQNKYTVLNDTGMPEHYTFVCPISADLRSQMTKITIKLTEFKDSLFLNDPANYHTTLFHCDSTHDIQAVTQRLETALESLDPMAFTAKGIFASSDAIVLVLFPENETASDLNSELSASINIPGESGLRKTLKWVSLARYREAPSTELKEYVRTLNKQEFGVFKPDEVVLYRTGDRTLDTATELKRIRL